MLFQVGQDLAAAPGEGIEETVVVAGKLEARHRPHHGRRDGEAVFQQAGRELVAVVRPDELLVPPQPRRLDAAPVSNRVARHVRHHAVGMELGVEVAAGEVAEACHHHAVGPDAGTAPGSRIPAPGLQEVRLHPVQRRPHRLVMGSDHPPVACDQAFQGHRLRRRERDVPARTVIVFALAHPPQADPLAGYMAVQKGFEARRADVAPQAEIARRASVPEARAAVFRVVLRVVAVALVVVDRRRR